MLKLMTVLHLNELDLIEPTITTQKDVKESNQGIVNCINPSIFDFQKREKYVIQVIDELFYNGIYINTNAKANLMASATLGHESEQLFMIKNYIVLIRLLYNMIITKKQFSGYDEIFDDFYKEITPLQESFKIITNRTLFTLNVIETPFCGNGINLTHCVAVYKNVFYDTLKHVHSVANGNQRPQLFTSFCQLVSKILSHIHRRVNYNINDMNEYLQYIYSKKKFGKEEIEDDEDNGELEVADVEQAKKYMEGEINVDVGVVENDYGDGNDEDDGLGGGFGDQTGAGDE